jgi:hypothetical protein
MDSELDKVLAKAKKVRTSTSTKIRISTGSNSTDYSTSKNENATECIPNNSKKKNAESYENTSTHTQILPPPPPSTADTLSSPAKPNTQTNDNYKQKNIRLTLPKSENSMRARYLQQLHGRLDLSKIFNIRSSLLKQIGGEDSKTNNSSNENNHAPSKDTMNDSYSHLASFLQAMGVARKKQIPEHVMIASSTKFSPLLSINGDSLDTFIVSIASRPTADQQVWQELHQVGYSKTDKDKHCMACNLQMIAQKRLIPELCLSLNIINSNTNESNDIIHVDGIYTKQHLKDILLVYRLTESMLKRGGMGMVRIATSVKQDID